MLLGTFWTVPRGCIWKPFLVHEELSLTVNDVQFTVVEVCLTIEKYIKSDLKYA